MEQRALVVSVAAGRAAPMPAAGPVVRTRRVRRAAPGRLLCWQLALGLAAVAVRQSWPLLAGLGGAAVALVLAATVRRRGRLLYEVIALWCRFLFRRGRRLPRGDSAAVTSIIRPCTVTPTLVSSFPAPADLLTSAGLPELFGVTTVFHATARPGAPRRVWLALDLARTTEMLADDELIPVLRHGMLLMRRTLHERGVRTEPVPENVVSYSGEVREGWRFVRTGPLSHACFALGGDDRPDLQRLTATLLSRSPGVAVTVSRSARWSGGDVTTTTHLHLAAPNPTAIDAAASHAARLLSPIAIRLTRLDGAHLAGIAASLPIGGPLP
ncbi:MAG TPA: hypothetical protein VHC18_25730 [Amycolatopsis sp.]|nr:hypothetical protein [Amycolatopsis sp.]